LGEGKEKSKAKSEVNQEVRRLYQLDVFLLSFGEREEARGRYLKRERAEKDDQFMRQHASIKEKEKEGGKGCERISTGAKRKIAFLQVPSASFAMSEKERRPGVLKTVRVWHNLRLCERKKKGGGKRRKRFFAGKKPRLEGGTKSISRTASIHPDRGEKKRGGKKKGTQTPKITLMHGRFEVWGRRKGDLYATEYREGKERRNSYPGQGLTA